MSIPVELTWGYFMWISEREIFLIVWLLSKKRISVPTIQRVCAYYNTYLLIVFHGFAFLKLLRFDPFRECVLGV